MLKVTSGKTRQTSGLGAHGLSTVSHYLLLIGWHIDSEFANSIREDPWEGTGCLSSYIFLIYQVMVTGPQ